MAIQIVSRGIAPSEREWIGKCSRCETVVQYKQSDAKRSGQTYQGEWSVVDCPLDGCCGEIYGNPLPPRLRVS